MDNKGKGGIGGGSWGVGIVVDREAWMTKVG